MELSGHYIKGSGAFEIKELSVQDNVLKDLDKGKQYWECTSSGTFAERQPYAYGSGRFWLYKGSDSTTPRVHFIKSNITNAEDGYQFLFTGSEHVNLKQAGNDLFLTVASYIAINTWYEIEWDHELDGTFTIRIRGGAFGNTWTLINVTGGSGSNPILDNTYTESIYQVFDLDVGDKYIPGVQKEGVEQ